jgi:LCP family protein required for cell wall assembly
MQMEPPKINFLEGEHQKKRRFRKFLRITAGLFCVFAVWLLASNIATYYKTLPIQAEETAKTQPGLFGATRQFFKTSQNTETENETRINVLFLGMGGVGHDGPYLTDTMILGSFDTKTKKAALLSIPRDLSVYIPKYEWRKINHVNSFGEDENPGEGGEYAKQFVSELLDIPIHYYIRMDFDGFMKLIDDMGGVDVCVDESFTDPLFPTDNYKYQTLNFKKGCQTMSGERALQFARSRHGTGNEGSDFARSHRQQKIITALKDKIFSFSMLLSPGKVAALFNSARQNIQTDFEVWEMIKFANLLRGVKSDGIVKHSLDSGTGGLLVERIYEGAYLLEPRTGNFDEIKGMVKNIFNPESKNISIPSSSSKVRVEIQNGTNITGLANQINELVVGEGFNILKIGNAKTRDYQKTVIYDFSNGNYPKELANLKDKLKANVAVTIPGYLMSDVTPSEITLDAEKNPGIDFLIIAGAANYWSN